MWPSAASSTTTVQPERPPWAAVAWSSRLQRASVACTARRRSTAPSVGGSRARLAVTSRLASSPRACPPMPSATTHRPRSGRAAALSSLSLRTWPTWLRTAERKAFTRRAPPSRARPKPPSSMAANDAGGGRPAQARRLGGTAGEPSLHHEAADRGQRRQGCRRLGREGQPPWQPGRDLGQVGCRQLVQVRFQLLEAQPVPQRGQGQFFQAIVPRLRRPGQGGRRRRTVERGDQDAGKIAADPVDAGQPDARGGRAAAAGGEREAPDRGGEVGIEPAFAQLLAALGQRLGQPARLKARPARPAPGGGRNRRWWAACR